MVPFRSDFTARTSTSDPSAPLQGPAVGSSTSSDSAAPGGFDDVLRGITNKGRDAQPEASRDGSSTSSETTAPPAKMTTDETHVESSDAPTTGTPAAPSRPASTPNTKSNASDAPATTAATPDPAADAATVIAPPPPPAPKPLVLQMMDFAAAHANQAANGQAAQSPADGSTTPGAPSLGDETDLFGTAPGDNATGTPAASVASRFLARFPGATNQPNAVKAGVPFGKSTNTTTTSSTSSTSTASSSPSTTGASASATTSVSSSTPPTQQSDAAAAAVLAAMQAPGVVPPVTTPAAHTSGTNHAQGTDGHEANAVSETASGEALTQATKLRSTIAQSASGDAAAAGSANAFDDELSAVAAAGNANAASGAPAVDDATIAAALRTAATRANGGTNKTPSSSSTSTSSTTAPSPASTDGKSLSTLVGISVSTAAKSAAPAASPDLARPAAPVAAGGSRPTLTISMPDLMSSSTNRSMTAAIEAPALLASDTDAPAVMSQIVQAMRVQAAQGGGTAQVTLQPGYLGGVTLSVKVDSDGVSASVVADTPAVRDALRSQEPALRQALGEQGLKLEHFDVSEPAETPRKQSGGQQQAPQEQPRPRQQKRRDPSEPAFEFVA